MNLSPIKRFKKLQLYLLLNLSLLLGQGVQASEYVIMTEELAPFSYFENHKLTGLSVEIIREILVAISYPDVIRVLPWARAYREVLDKKNRVIFSMARNADRESLFKWAGPLISDRVFFYQRKMDTQTIKTLDDAKKVDAILVTRDFPEHKFLRSEIFSNLILTSDPVQSLKMLEGKRGSLVPMGELAAPNIVNHGGFLPQSIKRTDVMLFETELYIGFSRETPESEVKQWQDALDKIKASGKYAEILKKYIIE